MYQLREAAKAMRHLASHYQQWGNPGPKTRAATRMKLEGWARTFHEAADLVDGRANQKRMVEAEFQTYALAAYLHVVPAAYTVEILTTVADQLDRFLDQEGR